MSDSTARALISRVTVVTGRDSSFAMQYTVFPDLRPVSIASRSASVNLGFFILLSPFFGCSRTVRAQGHASMEKPFLKVNATFPHGGRGQSPCPLSLTVTPSPLGTTQCHRSHPPAWERVDATTLVALSLTRHTGIIQVSSPFTAKWQYDIIHAPFDEHER